MAEYKASNMVNRDLQDHPAFRAWCELQLATAAPKEIDILKEKRPKQNKRSKKTVYRLVGVGPAGSTVIGKRCRPTQAAIEDTIYQNILPHLPFRSLHYFGRVNEQDSQYCWLFLEDAGEETYSSRREDHRLLRARWLALLHTNTTRFATMYGLPHKGTKHYLERLQSTVDTLLNYLARCSVPSDDLAPLVSIVYQYSQLEASWAQVEELCDGVSWSLVHGDFSIKNLRVQTNHNQTVFLPFDWGEAGWGTPAIDIMHVDLNPYWSVARLHWPELTTLAIQKLASAGRIFRCIDAVYWALGYLKYGLTEKLISHMSIYRSWLANAIQAAGLAH